MARRYSRGVHRGGYEKIYEDKHSPTTRKDSTVPSSYSVQQPKLSSLLYLSLSPPCVLSLSPSLCHLTSSVSPVCLTDSKSPSLCPRSLCLPCQSLPASLPLPPPPPPLLALSLSLSLACLLASFLFPFLSLFSFCHPLTCLFFFLSLSHSLLPFPLPPAFCFAAMPLPAHLFCLFSSPPPPPPLSPR